MDEQLVVFELVNETYGVDINRVQSIIQMQEITYVPGAPQFIEGVINLRGAVVPVVDLRTRFELAHRDGQEGVVVIVELEEHQIGVIVDAVTDVTMVSEESIEPPSPLLAGVDTAYLRGIGKWGVNNDKMVILLDLDRIFTFDEQESLKQAA